LLTERFGGEGRNANQYNTHKTQTKQRREQKQREGMDGWNGSIDHWKIGRNGQMVEKGKKQL
jgi:hypothetical protein